MVEPRALSVLSHARTMLAEAGTLEEVRAIRDKAEAVRIYAKAAGDSLDLQNTAAEVKLRAERRAGELLANMEKKSNRHSSANTLLDLGISAIQSHRWQRLAAVSEEHFDKHVASVTAQGKELTAASVVRLLPSKQKPEKEWTLYACIEQLHTYVARMLERWPQDDVAALVSKLHAYAEEIETGCFNGGCNDDE